jgi:lipopolysaccharide/colanic/teichoic acid biosynthesis glycosyltransferase
MPSKSLVCPGEPRVVTLPLTTRESPPLPPPLLRPGWYHGGKRALDLAVALFLFVPAAPLILLSVLLVKLTSRGPAFYSQVRLGLNGRPFWIYKIRTMVIDSEKDGACWSPPGDPRVTPIGRVLRVTHLDELPQLWNVLRGDMSLVGPRPERPEFVPRLEQQLSRYRDRMLIRPGLTGLAQVQLPPDTDLDSVRCKLACDLFYAQRLGLWLDLRLILTTSVYLVGLSTRVPRRLLGIPDSTRAKSHYHQLLASSHSESPP